MRGLIEIMVAVLTAFMGLSLFGIDPLSHMLPFAGLCGLLWLLIDVSEVIRC